MYQFQYRNLNTFDRTSFDRCCILMCINVSVVCFRQGRRTELISLQKPLSGGLGFSVVGLRPEGIGGHGVFVRQVQQGSVADRSEIAAVFICLSCVLDVIFKLYSEVKQSLDSITWKNKYKIIKSFTSFDFVLITHDNKGDIHWIA